MKKWVLHLVLICYAGSGTAQQRIIDSIKAQMPTKNDTLMLVWSKLLSEAFDMVDADSVPVYNKMYLALCKKLNFPLQEADALRLSAYNMARTRNLAEAHYFLKKAQQIVEDRIDNDILPTEYSIMLKVPPAISSFREYRTYISGKITLLFGGVYWLSGRNNRAYIYIKRALDISLALQAPDFMADCYLYLGVLTENDDSSLYCFQKSRDIAHDNHLKDTEAEVLHYISERYASKKDFPSEFYYRALGLQLNTRMERLSTIGWEYLGLADYYNKRVIKEDSAVFYSHMAMEIADRTHYASIAYEAALNLSNFYKKQGRQDSAYKYLELLLQAREKIANGGDLMRFENMDYAQQLEEAAIKAAEEQLRNKVKTYSFLSGIGVLMVLAIIFWRSNKRKQKEYKLLEQQKYKTEEALQNLKATQMQLVQSEKMASLGELTAGIAHEIQNPLNFVNNFSDLSNELMDEMNEKLDNGKLNEAKEIATGIKQNLEKINYHGKRADGIVKGMLQHSGKSTGAKEPTDINKLAEEYARLAYHGLRAKDKAFNATIKTGFDESITKFNIIPQDIGRVVLNLINNAFYAVREKQQQQPDDYEPTVSISTKGHNGKIEITVSDNGNGIPTKLVDKIFQPFFTTKPTGQGTGLGLSLAYDIVKAHGGEIRVQSTEGHGTAFTISLPEHSNN